MTTTYLSLAPTAPVTFHYRPPHKAFIELTLDSDGHPELTTGVAPTSTPHLRLSVSDDIRYRRTQIWRAYHRGRATPNPHTLLPLLSDRALPEPLATVHQGHRLVWDGEQCVGTLDESARQARRTISKLLHEPRFWTHDEASSSTLPCTSSNRPSPRRKTPTKTSKRFFTPRTQSALPSSTSSTQGT